MSLCMSPCMFTMHVHHACHRRDDVNSKIFREILNQDLRTFFHVHYMQNAQRSGVFNYTIFCYPYWKDWSCKLSITWSLNETCKCCNIVNTTLRNLVICSKSEANVSDLLEITRNVSSLLHCVVIFGIVSSQPPNNVLPVAQGFISCHPRVTRTHFLLLPFLRTIIGVWITL